MDEKGCKHLYKVATGNKRSVPKIRKIVKGMNKGEEKEVIVIEGEFECKDCAEKFYYPGYLGTIYDDIIPQI